MQQLADDEYLFTSESVTEGHPDKMADQISDAVLDAALAVDPESRVACETLVTTGLAVIAGEITTTAKPDFTEIVRDTICEIGYDTGEFGFDGHHCAVMVCLDKQSPDIAQGVDSAHERRRESSEDDLDSVGAGDQGMMFGYATNETPELMPLPIALAHRLARQLAAVRKSGTLDYLRPDGKTQVTIRYRAGVPVGIEKVLVSSQHAEGVEDRIPDDLWEHVVLPVLPAELYDAAELRDSFYANPTGRFVIGGPVGDAGLTGRKIIVDTYGGFARHGGGAFSGKDPSKVDRSAAYAARHVAKNIVAAGLADRAEVQVAYAIGVARPLSMMVETFGTEKVPRSRIAALVQEHFDLRPAAFRDSLKLHRPIYKKTAAYGHFGRDDDDFTWEHTDKADVLPRLGRPRLLTAGDRLSDEPYLQLVWLDPELGCHGYAVLDRLVDGLAGGGIRMHAGVTMAEVAGLARAMTYKKALAGALGGGAKGGIDLDPADPRAGPGLRRYVEAMRPLLRTRWSAAGDLGVSESQLAAVFEELGLGLTVQALADRMPDPAAASEAIAAALRVSVEGVPLGDWTAGYGAAHAVAAALAHDGRAVEGTTVAIQGFGPVGATAALALRDLGAHVVAVADAEGLLAYRGGLDLDRLLTTRDGHGRLDRAALPAAYERHPGDDWLALDVDVLVPAAVAGAIDADSSERVQATIVVEAANLPTTAAAQARLHARRIRVVPDIVANAGTTAWFTWLATGEIPPEAAPTFDRLHALIRETVPLILERADAEHVTTHEAARRVAERRLAERVAVAPSAGRDG